MEVLMLRISYWSCVLRFSYQDSQLTMNNDEVMEFSIHLQKDIAQFAHTCCP